MAKKLIIIPVIIIIILGGIASIFGFRVWDPLWNPFRPEPEEVIEKMTAGMKELKSFQADLGFDITIANGEKSNFNGEIRAKQDVIDSQNPKLDLNFRMAFNVEGVQILFGGEYKNIGENHYLKLTTLPILPLLGYYFQTIGIDISEIKNQWIKINPVKSKASPVLAESKIQTSNEVNLEFLKQEKEAMGKIKGIMANKNFYLIKEELEDKIIGKNKVYHYIIALNKEEIKNLIVELSKLIGSPYFKSEDLDKILEKKGEWPAEIWIGKEDKYLYRFKGEKEIEIRENEIINIEVNIDFSDFNQLIEISSPQEFTQLEIRPAF